MHIRTLPTKRTPYAVQVFDRAARRWQTIQEQSDFTTAILSLDLLTRNSEAGKLYRVILAEAVA
jgi:hypothetical protein